MLTCVDTCIPDQDKGGNHCQYVIEIDIQKCRAVKNDTNWSGKAFSFGQVQWALAAATCILKAPLGGEVQLICTRFEEGLATVELQKTLEQMQGDIKRFWDVLGAFGAGHAKVTYGVEGMLRPCMTDHSTQDPPSFYSIGLCKLHLHQAVPSPRKFRATRLLTVQFFLARL